MGSNFEFDPKFDPELNPPIGCDIALCGRARHKVECRIAAPSRGRTP